MNSLVASFEDDKLKWYPEIGVGFYPVEDSPYDAAYWAKYRKMDRTPVGDALTAARVQLVRKYGVGPLVDIGIGGGRFVEDFGAYGYDINPEAVAWLEANGRYLNPYMQRVEMATFWDSLEHIHDPRMILANVRRYAFVSCPIFDDAAHVLRSKHFRKDEHCWYFTQEGIVWFMERYGFSLREANRMEEECGREDIGTFVFERAL